MTEDPRSKVSHFLKRVVLGGLFAILNLGAFLALVVSVAADGPPNYLLLGLSLLALIGFSLATVWAAGLWGRWGLAIFFALAPAILVLDYTTNPYFPVGSIMTAVLTLGIFSSRGRSG